ncbi:MAG: acyl--CoA ligase [Deltaproteobacteria bacterium]|nr:acyl--CoA ligase [Deltaproteobacteria bacterium]
MIAARSLAGCVRSLAESRPRDVAYYAGDRTLDWAGYHDAADRLARVLLALDIQTDERVAVWLGDGAAVHIALQACERAGLVALGLGARSGERELAHLLALAEARVLISTTQVGSQDAVARVARLRDQGTQLRHHVIVHGEAFQDEAIQVDGAPARLAEASHLEGRGLEPDQVFLFNSTSGTTGLPKIVVHDQMRWMEFHRLAADVGHLTSSDVIMSAVPAPFGFGIWTSHVTPTLLGVPTVVMPRFDAEQAIRLLVRHRVTMLAAVSTQFIMMLETNLLDDELDLALRCLFTGGEAVPEQRARRFEQETGAAVLQFYGSNETGAVSATRPEDPTDKRLGTAGRPLPVMNLRLFDAQGNDVTGTGRGQPAVKGPVLSRGYHGAAEANAELVREDGWMLLGDLVEIDAEGYLRVVGRTDDIIIRGGKNLSAVAIEEVVASHPAVALAAAIGIPDAILGEKAAAYVELRPGAALDLADLTAHLEASRVARELWPEALVVLDALPQSAGGKVAKGALRDDAATRFALDEATDLEARSRAGRRTDPV